MKRRIITALLSLSVALNLMIVSISPHQNCSEQDLLYANNQSIHFDEPDIKPKEVNPIVAISL
jgi:hypothetical protein